MNKEIRSVVDSYVASYIELCKFESQHGRFLQILFFHLYIILLRINTFLRSRTSFNFFPSFHIFSLSLLILFSSFYHLSDAITLKFSLLHLANFLQTFQRIVTALEIYVCTKKCKQPVNGG